MAKKAKKKKPAAADVAAAQPMSLNKFLTNIKEEAKLAAAEGEPRGACLIPDSHTGGNICILTDKVTCGKLKGVFIGGPCGG